ncbi:MAG: bifunctional 5,10-methylenetetrahydrofolate dehydrogenase/5,10-methenyltetrahydrofolate cyclohydrolase [Candidatus Thermoplasmatota archaeon]|nr:bifunctional 5,10-methylenetetrahydrofolate dehydrogenase/5,10-methenyltetrahydrofolate cyclohydrolase [Candidatus Thermoplasmatota archaeon]MCL5437606.1 bifunctional 5,10-methylenetetrahydrofolate dehydrogenase/5,10-methenyltetrahydrofolate cyclohydrolase [Candidatus Thermoplasmatota archaeon]
MEIIDCRSIAGGISSNLKEEFDKLSDRLGRPPVLAVVTDGDSKESASYLRSRKKSAEKLGIVVRDITYGSGSTKKEILEIVRKSSSSSEVDGVMVSFPLPFPELTSEVADVIPWNKDVDCINPRNHGLIMENREFVAPATAMSVMKIIESEGVRQGSTVAVVNRSVVIGRPLAMMLLNRNYTPIVCHTKTVDLKGVTQRADVVVVGAGKARLVDASWISEGTTVIDAGINVVDGHVIGDVDQESMSSISGRMTSVPGGVGPVTTQMLFSNLLKCAESQLGNR